jgi:hypothetical protein
VKEALHRESWPSQDGTIHDFVGYSIIREGGGRQGHADLVERFPALASMVRWFKPYAMLYFRMGDYEFNGKVVPKKG